MRIKFLCASFLVLAACSQERGAEEAAASGGYDAAGAATEAASDAASEAPSIGPSAAPGVAFNYRYAFRLPATRVAAVQEEHAAACEKLGLNRCRITGMRYRLVEGEDIQAMLAFKLDPELARQFGKDGIAAVTRAEGMLVDSEISGEDVGTGIKQSSTRSKGLRERLAEIEARLKQGRVPAAERAELQQQVESLREQLANEAASRTDGEEMLAKTPMVFDYGSGSAIPGFDGASPMRDAWRASVGSFVTMVGFILMALGVLLPWILVGLVALAVWRTPPLRAVRGWVARREAKSSDRSPQAATKAPIAE